MLTVLSKVWDSVSEGVAKRFLERILGPAILFWGVGRYRLCLEQEPHFIGRI
jgi:hypothetical protein